MSRTKKWTPIVAIGALLVAFPACDDKSKTEAPEATATPAAAPTAETATATETKLSDGDITAAVQRRLFADGTLHGVTVSVATTDGVVSLIGETDNLITKERAELLAATVKGVRSIANRIDVKSPERPDGDIAREVENSLTFDAAADAYEIDVAVDDQVVTLQGKVESWQERQHAERLAKGIRGVKDVKNQLEVDVKERREDREILADINARLRWDALVDAGLLRADVDDGVVTLSGVVGSLAEKIRARSDAWVAGTKRVDDSDVKVEWWAKRSDLRKNLPTYRSDADIANAVKSALLVDPRVASFDVDVTSDAGVVTLKGTVTSLKAKRAAESLARSTMAVSGVKNEIIVDMPKAPSDAVLADRARAVLLFDPLTAGYTLPVTVKDGVATLTGSVDTFAQKAEAEDAVSSLAGIKAVENQLKVRNPVAYLFMPYSEPFAPLVESWVTFRPATTALSDETIQKAIADDLFWSPFLHSADINVKVEAGKATLTGTVDTWNEHTAATLHAYEGGARVVDNQLKVK